MSEFGGMWEWVTIGEAGPYKVVSNGDSKTIWIQYGDRTMEVAAEWCVKVVPKGQADE